MKPALQAIINQWHPPRDRVLWSPVLLGCGIALYFVWPVEPLFWASAAVLVLATALFIGFKIRAPQVAFIGGAVFLMALGFVLAQGRGMMVHAPMLEKPTGITRVEGRILDVSVTDDDAETGKRKLTLGDLKIEKLAPEDTPKTIRLSTRHLPSSAQPGERMAVLAKLMPPSGPVSPDGFDYRRQAYFEQLGAVGYTLGKYERLAPPEAAGDVWFSRLRQAISRHITTHMKHPESAVVAALLAGERASIPENVNQDLRDSGLYHLLSISGLHVAIVCGVTFAFLRFLMALWPWAALHLPIKKYAALAALLVGIFYTLLAGAPVPTQRAMMTAGLVLFAVMLDRAALSLRTLAIVALFVLMLWPDVLVGVSFQLSFAAVISMLVFHEGIGRKWMVEGRDANFLLKLWGYFGGIVATTVLVSLATLPIILHHFGRVQIFGVLGNAAAMPLTSFIIMPAGMAAMVLMPFGLDGPFLKIVEWGTTAMLDIAHWVAHLPHAALVLPSLPLGPFLISAFGFLLLCLWRGWVRWLGLPLMIAAIAFGFTLPRPTVLVDVEGKMPAVSSGGEIVYLFKKPTKFVRNNWITLWGGQEYQGGKPFKQGTWQGGDVQVVCDDWACRITRGDKKLSILRDANAMAEECVWADMVITLDKAAVVKGCRARVLTSRDVYMAQGVGVDMGGPNIGVQPFKSLWHTRQEDW